MHNIEKYIASGFIKEAMLKGFLDKLPLGSQKNYVSNKLLSQMGGGGQTILDSIGQSLRGPGASGSKQNINQDLMSILDALGGRSGQLSGRAGGRSVPISGGGMVDEGAARGALKDLLRAPGGGYTASRGPSSTALSKHTKTHPGKAHAPEADVDAANKAKAEAASANKAKWKQDQDDKKYMATATKNRSRLRDAEASDAGKAQKDRTRQFESEGAAAEAHAALRGRAREGEGMIFPKLQALIDRILGRGGNTPPAPAAPAATAGGESGIMKFLKSFKGSEKL